MMPDIIDPMQHLKVFAILELILVLPIIVTGKKNYIMGFKSLARLSPNMDSLISMGTWDAFLYSIFAVYEILLGNTGYQMYFESSGVILFERRNKNEKENIKGRTKCSTFVIVIIKINHLYNLF